jgi:hypothetical protein
MKTEKQLNNNENDNYEDLIRNIEKAFEEREEKPKGMENEEYLNTYNYLINLYHIDPRIDFYVYYDFRLKSNTDFGTIIDEFFSNVKELRYTIIADASAVCIHKSINYINNEIINNFVFRGIKIDGEGVIIGVRDGKIIQDTSERPVQPIDRLSKDPKIKRENIILTEYNDFKPSFIDWNKAGDVETRKMDNETDGFWRIAHDLD